MLDDLDLLSLPAPSISAANFTFSSITSAEVTTTPNSIKSNAIGADGIACKMVMPLLALVLDFVVTVFNRSLEESTFPEAWKRAIIIAINKTPTPSMPGDYRPIAVLLLLAKTLEKLVFNQLTNFLNYHQLLDPFQCGFRAGHSIQIVLLKLINDIRFNMDNRKLTILVLFDFSKAFDLVPHKLLLHKLAKLGLSMEAILV